MDSIINRKKLRTKLNTLFSIMDSSDMSHLSTKLSIFNMSPEIRKQFCSGIPMGYNDYGIADSIKSNLINDISLLSLSEPRNGSVSLESIDLYIEFAIDKTKQYIIDEKPEHIHYVI